MGSLLILLACSQLNIISSLAQIKPETSPLKIGGIYGLTGPLSDFGAEFSRGAQLYIDSRPPASRRVDLLIEDSKWDSMSGVSAFKKLAERDGVKAVHVQGSGPSLAIKPLSEARGIILLSSAAHPDLIPGSSLVIRHGNLTTEDAHVLASYVGTDMPADSRLAAVYIQNDWGESFHHAFLAKLKSSSPALAVSSAAHLPSDTDFRPLLMKLLRASPKALLVNSFGISISAIVEQSRQLGFRGRIYVNNGLALSKPSMDRLRALRDPDIFWQTYPRLPEEFARLFKSRFGVDPGYFSLVSFGDLELLDYAVSQAGDEPSAIVKFIKDLGTFQGQFATLTISREGDILIPVTVEKFE